MKTDDFDFFLPKELIAQYPQKERSASRLLCLDRKSGAVAHRKFAGLAEILSPDDLLVLNDTEVIPARLFGKKASGGKVEILVEKFIDSERILAHVKASKSPRPNTKLVLEEEVEAMVEGRVEDLFVLRFLTSEPALDVLEKYGHIPLPPYIERKDENFDKDRYQTIYAKRKGAVAAPTAGLHFDEKLLKTIAKKGVQIAYVTLHVGAGTFQPVRVQNIEKHKMHAEWIDVSPEICEKVEMTKDRGGKVVAVGTTCVRSLETAAKSGKLMPFKGETDIFIYPGFQFNCVDAIITNFHLPKSTLLMLVSAFTGYQNTMNAYKEAVKEGYRFFSYGDAMFIG